MRKRSISGRWLIGVAAVFIVVTATDQALAAEPELEPESELEPELEPLAEAVPVERYVADNLVAVFYHELGHALIDQLELPVYGQEEDAADVLSMLMVLEVYEQETAIEIALNIGAAYLADAQAREQAGEAVSFWGVHGTEKQRYYNAGCLLSGAYPEEQEVLAAYFDLPEERLDTCVEEFEMAASSWGGVFDELWTDEPAETIVLEALDSDEPSHVILWQLVHDEIVALNTWLALPYTLKVRVEACGEANAFYDPEVTGVLMCAEYTDYLQEQLAAQ